MTIILAAWLRYFLWDAIVWIRRIAARRLASSAEKIASACLDV
jgi:hypothetical protein